jgi:hypothetical protein
LVFAVARDVFLSSKLEHDPLPEGKRASDEQFERIFILSAQFVEGFPLEGFVLPDEELPLVAPASEEHALGFDLVGDVHEQHVEVAVREVIRLINHFDGVLTPRLYCRSRRDQRERSQV